MSDPEVTVRRMRDGEERLLTAMWQLENCDHSQYDFRVYCALDREHFWTAVDSFGEPVGR